MVVALEYLLLGTIEGLNAPPDSLDASISAVVDTPYVFKPADFPFTSIHTLAGVKLATLPVLGSITLDGSPVVAGQLIPIADITSGMLKFAGEANDIKSGYTSFTFQVQDDFGTSGFGTSGRSDLDPSPNTITVNVTEKPSLIVTTNTDIADAFDGVTSLREAVAYANTKANVDADTPDVITFDQSVFTGGAANVIRLSGTLGTLQINDAVKIDGDFSNYGSPNITITGDVNGDDTIVNGLSAGEFFTAAHADNIQIITASASLSIDGLKLTGGRGDGGLGATGNGGAIEGTIVTVSDSVLGGNEADYGGAIKATTVEIHNSTLSGNATSQYGGAIYASSDVRVTNSVVSDNSGYFGGGIRADSSVTITASTISNNQALSGGIGGGVYAFTATITDSTLSGNYSDYWGGALSATTLTMTNSTLSDNSGLYAAGGIYTFNATITNSTITGNRALTDPFGYGGGGVTSQGGTVTLENSIITGNNVIGLQTARDLEIGGGAILALNGGNIIGTNVFSGSTDVGDTSAAAIFAQTTNPMPNRPVAGVLADNGGPVQTVALKLDVTNPALDRSNASAPPTDARGIARQDQAGVGNNGSNFADLGAFEAIDQPPVITAFPLFTSIAENASTAAGIKFSSLTIVDQDGNNTPSLSGADAALFELKSDGIYLKPGTLLDFETNPVLDVTLNVATLGNGTVSAPASFAVTDVNEAPTALSLTNQVTSLIENTSTAARRKIADIAITDDALGTETITLTGADAGRFEIFGGDLYLKAGATLDFETNPKLDVTVNVDDTTLGSGIELSRALSVNVTDALETISGSSGANTLNGSSGADRINAGAGNDTVNGGGGNDIIYGGAGVDRLTGGTGRDTFAFKSITESGYHASGSLTERGPLTDQAAIGQRDIITDFTPGFDEIDLSAIDANTNASGNQAFTFRGTGAFAGAGSLVYRKFDNTGTASDRTIVFADTNGDGRSDFQIELTGLKTLAVGDFVL